MTNSKSLLLSSWHDQGLDYNTVLDSMVTKHVLSHLFIILGLGQNEIAKSIKRLQAEHKENESEVEDLRNQNDNDLQKFLDFAFAFLDDKGKHFFELSEVDMKRCKQLVFPAEIFVDENKNVYTHEISSIFRYKKDPEGSDLVANANVVQHS